MIEDSTPFKPPKTPKDEGKEVLCKIIWLFVAFIPSVGGIYSLHMKNPGLWVLPALFFLNLICCVASTIGLVRGMRNEAYQALFAIILIPFFFVINIILVLFAGCSDVGRIAP